jgi:hypothetical protein
MNTRATQPNPRRPGVGLMNPRDVITFLRTLQALGTRLA